MVYGLYRALPGAPGLLATVACAPFRRLDTSVGVSGPHDFARPPESALVLSAPCVHRILPRVSDVGQRPPGWTGHEEYRIDFDSEKQKYFFEGDWTGQITLIPQENFFPARIGIAADLTVIPGLIPPLRCRDCLLCSR